jgi:hypothetical protein
MGLSVSRLVVETVSRLLSAFQHLLRWITKHQPLAECLYFCCHLGIWTSLQATTTSASSLEIRSMVIVDSSFS